MAARPPTRSRLAAAATIRTVVPAAVAEAASAATAAQAALPTVTAASVRAAPVRDAPVRDATGAVGIAPRAPLRELAATVGVVPSRAGRRAPRTAARLFSARTSRESLVVATPLPSRPTPHNSRAGRLVAAGSA
ncbi:MAG TPA: hypothetical protein VEH05_18450 [Streptosporangiaceae bacterium]|nr:hypothetical protein [Streptosporangiaceae bacterium]